MKSVSILGSTGSIGTQAIEVCRTNGFKVVALAAKSNAALLARQAIELRPKAVCIFDEDKLGELKELLYNIDSTDGTPIEIKTGILGLCEIASIKQADVVLNSVVGMIGLEPTLAAIRAKKDVALANKETLVTGGKLVMQEARDNNVKILPVDSEHSAIFQSLQGSRRSDVKKLWLTASGGPFFGKTKNELSAVTKNDALKHPNWDMGAKITIDSATMMNKGLELIEACWLFDVSPDEVEIVIHRESIVHSMVQYCDNAVIAQLSVPDMRVPIQYALSYPSRAECGVSELSFFDCKSLTFDKPDLDSFDCLKAAIRAAKQGGLYPTVLNGANEQAVSLFLEDKISFLDIGRLVASALSSIDAKGEVTLENIKIADQRAREFVLLNSTKGK